MRYVGLLVSVCWLTAFQALGAAYALPAGRHYELVSPVYKGGYGVNFVDGAAMAGDGEGDSVEFESLGAFAGAESNLLNVSYVARRGANGWSTEAVSPPASLWPRTASLDVEPTLERSFFGGHLGPDSGAAQYEGENQFVIQDRSTAGVLSDFGARRLKRLDGKQLSLFYGDIKFSEGYCHVIFKPLTAGVAELPEEALLPEAQGTSSSLYELTTGAPGCDEGEALRLVAVGEKIGPHGEPEPLDSHCVAVAGAPIGVQGSQFNAVSKDGREVFFETSLNQAEPGCDGLFPAPKDPAVLFARLDGQKTLELSTPIAADCAKGAPCYKAIEAAAAGGAFSAFESQQRAVFQGASEDGARVFFTTMQPLVTGDSEFKCEERPGGLDAFETQADCESGSHETEKGQWKRFGNDVYMANVGCPDKKEGCAAAEREATSLVQVSRSVNAGEPAEVQGVAVSSPDGSRVYYVAQGVLSAEAGPEGSHAVKGADNFYVYDAAEGTTRFIAELCSGSGRSGEAQDTRCPNDESADDGELWGAHSPGVNGEVQTAGIDGRYVVFTSYAQLVADDTDSTRDVYRYDALTGSLSRVSVGEEGSDANGNNDVFGAELPNLTHDGMLAGDAELNSRAISEDGEQIVFETAEPLSRKAVKGLTSVYEWHDGKVALLSSGTAAVGPEVMITPSGRDVFFVTDQSLVEADTDEVSDVYDAREGEGFPPAPTPRLPCSADACQGPLTNPAPLLVPGSVSQAPGENLAPAQGNAKGKPKAKAKHKPKKPRKSRGKMGRHGPKRGLRARRARTARTAGRGGR